MKCRYNFSILFLGLLQITTLFCLGQSENKKKKTFQNAFLVNNDVTVLLDSLAGMNARGNLKLAHSLYEKSTELLAILSSSNDSFAYFYSRGNFEYKNVSIENGFNSLYNANLVAKRANNMAQVASSFISIGNAHYYVKDIKSAISNYREVADIKEAQNGVKAAAAHNIGALLFETVDSSKSQSYIDSITPAIDSYLRKAIRLSLNDGNDGRLAATYSVIVPWFGFLKQFDSAYIYANLAMKNAANSGFPNRVNFARINLARVLVWNGFAKKSLPILDSAIHFFDSIGFKEQVIHAHRVKVWAYDSLKDYKNAARTAEKTYNMIRETFPLKLDKAVGEYKALYDYNSVELKNKELIISNQKRDLLNTRLRFALLSLLLVLGLFYLWYRYRLKKQKIAFQEELFTSNLNSQEEEKKRIARELHDGVGQQISSIKLGLENIDRSQLEADKTIDDLRQLVSSTLQSVRGISHQLMPLALQRFGLVKALESLVEFMDDNSSTDYKFENFNVTNIELSDTDQIHLYRIAQELLQNVSKHSEATSTVVQLFSQKEKLHLTISDNGVGLSLKSENYGIGLANIKTRVEAINGTIQISSKSGDTTIQIVA